MPTVTVDSTWLTANGPAPYALAASNTTYRLATNVTVTDTAFVFHASGSTLDLAGYTITYDNGTFSDVTNGGFESSTIGTVAVVGNEITGWDFSACLPLTPTVIANNTTGDNVTGTAPVGLFFDDNCLQVTLPGGKAATIATGNPATITCTGHGFSTGDRVYLNYGFVTTPAVSSSPGNGVATVSYPITVVDANNFTIPVNVTVVTTASGVVSKAYYAVNSAYITPTSGMTYTATVFPSNAGSNKTADVWVEFWDSVTGLMIPVTILGYSGATTQNAVAYVAYMTAATTNPFYIKMGFAAPSTASQVLVVDGITARRSFNVGVLGTNQTHSDGGRWLGWSNIPSGLVSGLSTNSNLSVIDSTIAKATVTLNSGSIDPTTFTVTQAGSYRNGVPTLTVEGPLDPFTGVQAVGTAVLSGGTTGYLTGVTWSNHGSNYAGPVTLIFSSEGAIVQGTQRCYGAMGVNYDTTPGTCTVDGVNITFNASMDAIGIYGTSNNGSPANAHRVCTFDAITYTGKCPISARYLLFSAIEAKNSSGNLTMTGCTLTGFPQCGITYGVTGSGYTTTITNNTLVGNNDVTNCYAVNIGGIPTLITCTGNSITGYCRGIIADSSGGDFHAGPVEYNFFDISENQDRQYDGSDVQRCIRVRNDSNSPGGGYVISGLSVSHNNMTARAGPGGFRQATAVWLSLLSNSHAVSAVASSPGTGYVVNDTLTAVGGTSTAVATFTVASVGGGGAITGLTVKAIGTYSVAPTNPVTVTGGSGTGATLTVTWENQASNPVEFKNNRFRALVSTTDSHYNAFAFTLDGMIAGIGAKFSGNVYQSNDTALQISYNDAGYSSADCWFQGELFQFNDDGGSVPDKTFQPVSVGYSYRQCQAIYLADCTVDTGSGARALAGSDLTWTGSGTFSGSPPYKQVYLANVATVTVHDGSGNPVSGATVSASGGAPVYWSPATTDSSGIVTLPLPYTEYTVTSTNAGSAPGAPISHGPYTLTGSATGYTSASASVGATSDSSTTLVLTGGSGGGGGPTGTNFLVLTANGRFLSLSH